MKLKSNMLYVLKNTTDYSTLAHKMGIEEISLSLTNSDYIYVGYTKPIKNLFLELKTPNTNTVSLTAEYHNGTAWTSVDIIDETKGLKKSNFIYLDDAIENNKEYTHNSIPAYWVRLKVSGNTTAMVLAGLNCLFCSEDDLKPYFNSVASYYPKNAWSHIGSLVAATNFILRKINNSNGYKYILSADPLDAGNDYVYAEDFTQFDVHHIDEIRDAAVQYALHLIYQDLSDDVDDKWQEKANQCLTKFNEIFKLWSGRKLTLDIDGDGKEDDGEKELSISRGSFIR